nr:ATP-binding protein [Zobellella iuensis]
MAERLGRQSLPLPEPGRQSLELLLRLVSRDGPLFRLKNEELDLRYQEQFLVANSQRHVRQLAIQIAHYSEAANRQVDTDIAQSAHTVARASHATLLLSLLSLVLVAGISWLYVSRNVLARIARLQHNMRAIASGRLDTPIRIRGRDEVAGMARDLRHFQLTALRAERARHRLAREIEDRLHAERQLRLTQEELIQAGKLAALGQLSVAITHEINQPLNAMSTQLHSVGRYLARNEADKAEQGLGKLRQLLDKAGTITRHLRSFARKADSRLSPVALAAVVEAAVELLQPRWHGVTLSIAGDADTLVQAEAIRLEQVLVNLLGNALDALEGRPSPEVRIHWRQYRDQVQLSLEDNGCGIPPEQMEQIFDPYYTTKAPGKGLGLGLAISYNIMQDLGGQIRLSSTPDRGTTFNLRFNRA